MADASAFTGRPVTQVTTPVRTDHRLVPVQEQRIAMTVLAHLGAIEGMAHVDDRFADIARRLLAPTVNAMAQELRAAGYRIGRDDEGARA